MIHTKHRFFSAFLCKSAKSNVSLTNRLVFDLANILRHSEGTGTRLCFGRRRPRPLEAPRAACSTSIVGKYHQNSTKINRNHQNSKEINDNQWKSMKIHSFHCFIMRKYCHTGGSSGLTEPRQRYLMSLRMSLSPSGAPEAHRTVEKSPIHRLVTNYL